VVERATPTAMPGETVDLSRLQERLRSNRGRTTLAVVVAILGLVLLLGVFGGALAPHDPFAPSLSDRLTPPFWQSGGSAEFPLGTDSLGRDILSRIMLGARSTLVVATAALLSGALIGTILGMIGGFFGGTIDAFISRAADITIGFPMILVALLFAVTVGPRPENVVISVAAILWARFARVIRGEVVSLRQRGYVESARVSHMPTWWILLRHILPNILSTVLVLASLQMGWVIIVEASLSFLGAGIPLPEPAWGAMVADGRDYITEAWWISTMPGVFIVVTVLALNLLGDWLRDALDPTLRVS